MKNGWDGGFALFFYYDNPYKPFRNYEKEYCMDERFIDRKLFAERLGISLSSLSRHRNTFPLNTYVKIGRRLVYPVSVLEKLSGDSLKKAIDAEGAK